MNVPLLFVDTETTSLERPSSPRAGEVWEVAAIRRNPDGTEHARLWHLPVTLANADPISLKISHFHERHAQGDGPSPHPVPAVRAQPEFVTEFAAMAEGCHWIGNVPGFDEERIAALFHTLGIAGSFPWHYHLIDIETLIVGHLRGLEHGTTGEPGWPVPLPWSSDVLSTAIGVDPNRFDRHTAMGDVRWCIAQWDALHTQRSTSGAPA